MEAFIEVFENLPPWQKLIWILGCLSLYWVIEGVRPLFKGGFHRWKHTRVNLFFLATTILINVLVGVATVGVFEWIATEQIGLMHYVDWHWGVELFITILILDLVAQYTVHYCLHKWKWMWRLHMIHHSDTHVDATTGTRHHPIDFVVREVFAIMAVIIAGAPVAFYVFYRITTIFFTYMTHANVNLPLAVDKAISYVFISPNMHKFHHHFERPWTDTNFGNMFSIWDRIFGTYVYGDPSKIEYGLDVVDNSRGDDLKYQLGLPFRGDVKTDY